MIFFILVCRFIKRYSGEEAADIAQEVFVKVYERWGEFETVENVKAFLYIIARNLSLDYLKHKRAENNEIVEQTFLKEVTRQETFRILYNAIDRLPGQTRQFVLLSLEGNSVQEVGDKKGVGY